MYLEGGNFCIFTMTGFSLENSRKSGHFLVRKHILRKMKSCHPLNTSGGTLKYIFMLSIPKCNFLQGCPYAFHPNIPPYLTLSLQIDGLETKQAIYIRSYPYRKSTKHVFCHNFCSIHRIDFILPSKWVTILRRV